MTVSVVLTKPSTLHCLQTLFHAAISVKVVLPLLNALLIEKVHVLQMGSLTCKKFNKALICGLHLFDKR